MTSKEAYNYLLGLLESGGDMRWSLVKESMDKFKELIDQQSNHTLLECIKEWNEKGFDVDIYALEIAIHNHNIEFTIDLKDKTLFMEGEYNSFPYDVVHLLSKTLKALEVENGK